MGANHTSVAALSTCPAGGVTINTAPQAFYQWQSPAYGTNGSLTVDTCGTAWDTKLFVTTTCPTANLPAGWSSCVGSNDDSNACGLNSKQSQVTITTQPGQLYFFIVTGLGSASGNFTMNFNWFCTGGCPASPSLTPSFTPTVTTTPSTTWLPPSPSGSYGFCPPSIPLVNSTTSSTTSSASIHLHATYCDISFGSSPQMFYTYTAPANTGAVYVDVCGGGGALPNSDTVLAVVAGSGNPCDVQSNMCIAANDDDQNTCGAARFKRSALAFSLPTGPGLQTFSIIVSGFYTTPSVDFTLNVTYSPNCLGGVCPSGTPTATSTPQSATASVSPVSPSSSPQALSPATLPGLLMWLRPDELSTATQAGPTNFTWTSYVNPQYSAVAQDGASNLPTPSVLTGALNGFAAVQFLAGGATGPQQLVSALDLSTQDNGYTIFMLVALNSSSGTRSYGTPLSQRGPNVNGAPTFALGTYNGYDNVAVVSGAVVGDTTAASGTPTGTLGGWALYELFVRPGESAVLLRWGSPIPASHAVLSNTSVPGPNGLRFGNIGLFASDVLLVEFSVYAGVLDWTARESAEGYLAMRYNLQSMLPAGHPYGVGGEKGCSNCAR
jgi:hypothetical protein